MHTRKKATVFAFAILCMLTITFALATVFRPNIVFVSFLVVSVAGAIVGAYRVFCFSNDWYRVQEEKEQRWYGRHPHLTSLLVVLGAGSILWQLFDFVRRLLR